MTVLIIEDDREVADLVTKLVTTIGEVTWRMNWASGMEALGNCQFDVILLDLGLPDSPTAQTRASIKPLKMQCPNSAVIVITGQPSVTEKMALEDGADGFIPKIDVLRPTRLIQLISSLVAKVCSSGNALEHQLILHKEAATEVSEQFKTP